MVVLKEDDDIVCCWIGDKNEITAEAFEAKLRVLREQLLQVPPIRDTVDLVEELVLLLAGLIVARDLLAPPHSGGGRGLCGLRRDALGNWFGRRGLLRPPNGNGNLDWVPWEIKHNTLGP